MRLPWVAPGCVALQREDIWVLPMREWETFSPCPVKYNLTALIPPAIQCGACYREAVHASTWRA